MNTKIDKIEEIPPVHFFDAQEIMSCKEYFSIIKDSCNEIFYLINEDEYWKITNAENTYGVVFLKGVNGVIWETNIVWISRDGELYVSSYAMGGHDHLLSIKDTFQRGMSVYIY